jgi:hypothetical protein
MSGESCGFGRREVTQGTTDPKGTLGKVGKVPYLTFYCSSREQVPKSRSRRVGSVCNFGGQIPAPPCQGVLGKVPYTYQVSLLVVEG